MTCETRFFRCDICGNLVGMIHASGAPMSCCGQHMTELIPGSVDASQEKHVPVIKVEGDKCTVHVGSIDHPMLEEHHIAWIYLQTDDGGTAQVPECRRQTRSRVRARRREGCRGLRILQPPRPLESHAVNRSQTNQ